MNKNEFARWLPEDAPIDDPDDGTDECWEHFKPIAGCTPEECIAEHVSLLTPDQIQYLQHHNKAVKITDQCDFTIGRDNDILERLFQLTGQPSSSSVDKPDKFVFPSDDIMWTGIPVPGMRIQLNDTNYTATYDIRIYTDLIQQQRMRITGELPPSPYQQLHHITTPQRMIDEPLIVGSIVTQHWVNIGYRSTNRQQSYGRIICPIMMMDHNVSIASTFHFTGVNEYQAAIDLQNGVITKEAYPYVHTPMQAVKIEGSYLERFYLVFHGINLALLNPVFKVSFTNTQRTKLINPPSSNNNKKQPIKYVRRIQINTDQFKTDITNTQQSHPSSYTRKTMLWHVAGHWSTSKSGKRYFVKPHFKGPLSHNQQSIDEFTPRERIPVINPSSNK